MTFVVSQGAVTPTPYFQPHTCAMELHYLNLAALILNLSSDKLLIVRMMKDGILSLKKIETEVKSIG